MKPGQKVLLAISPMKSDRRTLVGGPDKPDLWKNKSFRDPTVIDAYCHYCNDMINRFKPIHFIYGLEVNSHFKTLTEREFQDFLCFCQQVHGRLKAVHPNLTDSLEFSLTDRKSMVERQATMKALAKYSDLICISTYPYVPEAAPHVLGDARKIPADWFESFTKMFPGKNCAITETGFNSKLVNYWDRVIPGNQDSQDRYVRFMLNEATRLNFKMVNWWAYRDLDKLWLQMKAGGTDDAWSQWNSNGLVDSDGNQKSAYTTWKSWHELPI